MDKVEQAAFIEAYANNVADVSSDRVAVFVEQWANGEDLDYSSEYTSIMDALCVWNDAIKWKLTQITQGA